MTAGATVVNSGGGICKDAPNDDAIAELSALGKKLAALLA